MALIESTLKSAVRKAFKDGFDINVAETDTAGVLIAKKVSDGIADGFDSYMSAAQMDAAPVITPGSSTLKQALRTTKYSGWGTAFQTYMLDVKCAPAGPSHSSVVIHVIPATVIANAISLQAALDAIVSAGPAGSSSYQTTDAIADKITSLLSTFSQGHMSAIMTMSAPPVPGVLPIT